MISSKNCSKSPKNAKNFLAFYRTQSTRVLTVCQQHAQKVLAHCANSRISASVSTPSVLTVDMSVPTLERRPWHRGVQIGDLAVVLGCMDAWPASGACGAQSQAMCALQQGWVLWARRGDAPERELKEVG